MHPTDRRVRRGRLTTWLAGAFVATLAAGWITTVAAQELQVIELRHRRADQLIPALQPLLEPGGVITGTDATLLVRTSARNFAQIQQAVAALDRQPRQLRITVGQGTVETDSDTALRGSATVGSGDVQVGVNRPPAGPPGASVVARHTTQRADLRNVSSVTALEGSETFVAVGQSAPVTTTQVTPGWIGPNVVQTTDYRDANTGFYATARVSGDRVTLELAPQQQRFSGPRSDRRVATAAITTQVSGRLGDWIRVGGSDATGGGNEAGLLTWSTRSDQASYSVWVKVEELP